ncbi:MAG: crossover junction endodeoxyribonuclease RuvC [Candidatus Shikimatogenerans sp. JK-2022]|nr:crossover junction endodeoxyribonuclease RuvC [Candidatus Shikimatogenerans bostrichidophilus]
MNNKIILGIDPGLNILGISIIKIKSYIKNKIVILKLKELYLKNKKLNYLKKLKIIYLYINKIINKFKPNFLVMENTYLGKNVISMKRLIQCQSVISLAAINNKKKIIKYYPKTIKLIITGYGNSNKLDIKKKIEKILNFKYNYNNNYDIIDSLAVSICHILLYKKKQYIFNKKLLINQNI